METTVAVKKPWVNALVTSWVGVTCPVPLYDAKGVTSGFYQEASDCCEVGQKGPKGRKAKRALRFTNGLTVLTKIAQKREGDTGHAEETELPVPPQRLPVSLRITPKQRVYEKSQQG